MTSTELEHIDELRKRFDISYEEASQALRENNGDLVQSLVAVERKLAARPDPITAGLEMLDQVEGMSQSGPIRRIRVRYANRLLKDMPVGLTAFAAMAVSLLATFINRCSVEIEQEGSRQGSL